MSGLPMGMSGIPGQSGQGNSREDAEQKKAMEEARRTMVHSFARLVISTSSLTHFCCVNKVGPNTGQ